MNIASIDVGIVHLGLVISDVSWDNIEVKEVHLVDLTKHCRVFNCPLKHTNHLVDRVDHFVQTYRDVLDKADKVLIEKQPIQGLISVEQLIFERLRDKIVFVHPVSMHKYFGIRHLDYEGRKEYLVNKMAPHLEGTIFDDLERKHDVADAMAMIIYWRRKIGQREFRKPGDPVTSFECFRYTGDTSGT